ncbi:MAG: NAD(P)/FAD-dependent oxidoreductase [Spirochaetales bacterium]
MAANPKIVVIGGGFAGIQATKAIMRGTPNADITLIDRNPYATMLPALPDVLSGRVRTQSLTRDFADIFGDKVTCVEDECRSIDLPSRTIEGTSSEYSYDYLIIAAGSKPNFFGFSPEGGSLHTLDSFPAARDLRDKLISAAAETSPRPLLIVGGGYTGLEAAACVRHGFEGHDESLPIIVLEKQNDILPMATERERMKVRAYLKSINVELRTGASLERLTDQAALLSDGSELTEPIVCWTAGMQASSGDRAGEQATTRDKRFRTNEFLQLGEYPEVYVAGDDAALTDGDTVLRRAVNFAFYSGRRAGRNCAAQIRGRRQRPFRPADLGWIIPLGQMSIGRILGFIPIGGTLGLRIHYAMSAYRHFGLPQAWEFLKTAMVLRRRPDPPTV